MSMHSFMSPILSRIPHPALWAGTRMTDGVGVGGEKSPAIRLKGKPSSNNLKSFGISDNDYSVSGSTFVQKSSCDIPPDSLIC